MINLGLDLFEKLTAEALCPLKIHSQDITPKFLSTDHRTDHTLLATPSNTVLHQQPTSRTSLKRAMDTTSPHAEPGMASTDIAIVGYSFKLPQDVNDDASFWEILQNRQNLMTSWPESRLNTEAFVTSKNHKVFQLVPNVKTTIAHDLASFMAGEGISSTKIPVPLMPRFSQSRRKRPQRWILCSAGRWKRPTVLLKRVGKNTEETGLELC